MSSYTITKKGLGLERVNYFPRQLITAEDMRAEQDYFRQKLRRHNRFVHGWGTICGLEVVAAPGEGLPWQVRVECGYALSPHGDEIYVPEAVCLDLMKCGRDNFEEPCPPGRVTPGPRPRLEVVFVAVRYKECESRPVRVHPAGCACDETGCEYSRIRDDFELACLTELPESHRPGRQPQDLCDLQRSRQIPPCPPLPPDAWVVLATVRLLNQNDPLSDAQIDNFQVRRQLYRLDRVQKQVIECCCQTD